VTLVGPLTGWDAFRIDSSGGNTRQHQYDDLQYPEASLRGAVVSSEVDV
jgi:hypothetical protein